MTSEYLKQWRKSNPIKMKSIQKKNNDKQYPKIKAANAAHPENQRDKLLKKRFGISIEDYRRMEREQGGLCKICAKPESKTYKGKPTVLAVDHDHVTGRIRGLLCFNCNLGIGKFNDDVDIIKKAILYLSEN